MYTVICTTGTGAIVRFPLIPAPHIATLVGALLAEYRATMITVQQTETAQEPPPAEPAGHSS